MATDLESGQHLNHQTRPQGSSGRQAFVIAGLVLAFIGSIISVYSIQHHRELQATGQTNAFCNINQTISCDEVARSPFAELWGAPLGVYGLGYFLALIVLLGVGLRPKKGADASLQMYALMVAIGVVVSVALGGISTFKIGAVCLTCIMVYVVTLIQAIVLWVYRRELSSDWQISGLANAAFTALLVVVVINVGYKNLLSSTPKDLPASKDDQALSYTSKSYEIPIAKSAYSGFGEDYRKGGDNAAVVLVEFGDFQCPSCAGFSKVLNSLHEEFGDRALMVFKNFPLDKACNPSMNNQLHENACAMAVGARCAGQFGKFWPFHDELYAKQKDANEASVKKMLIATGIAAADVDSCFSSPSKYEKIKADVELGLTLDVDGTPAVYINGRKYVGNKDFAGLKAEIDRLLAQ